MDEGLDYNEYSKINDMTFEKANEVLKSLEFDNISIVKTIK